MTYKIVTLGCKVNSYESESFCQLFESLGYKKTDSNADIVIINTCSVTSTSDQKSRQMIRRENKLSKDAILIVVGCYAQVSSKEISQIDGVDIIIGSKYKDKIIELIEEYKVNKKQIIRIEDSNSITKYEEIKVCSYSENTRAFLKIQDGCNNFCSYCQIPFTRGRSRSREKDNIIKEAKILVSKGFKEIVLTGVDTANYGNDLDNYNFVDLLKDLLKEVKGLERLRISSIENSQISDDFINLIKDNKVIVHHLHIPLQSGSDTILKKMNRKYNCEAFYEKINKLRNAISDISITCDVIVGFPYETDELFNETYDFIEKCQFSMLHVFPYSIRKGTVAGNMSNQVNSNVKKERVKKLLDLSNKLSSSFLNNLVNKDVEVLFETIDDKLVSGHCQYYFKTICIGDKTDINQIRKVHILGVDGINLIGEIIR